MKNILILGSSGFVGSNLVKFFYKKYNLKLFDIKNFNKKKFPKVIFKQKNLLDFKDTDLPDNDFIVINVAALLGSKKYDDNITNNVLALKKVVKVLESQKKNFKGIIHFSSISAQRRISHYGYSKFLSEKVIKNSNLPYIILQSEMIIGKNSRSIDKILKISKLIPFILPFPKGGNVFRYPIDILQVMKVIENIINLKRFDRKTYSLVSKKILLSNLLKNITNKKIINIPSFLIFALAKVFEKIFKNPPFTFDNAYGICNSTKLKFPKYVIKKN